MEFPKRGGGYKGKNYRPQMNPPIFYPQQYPQQQMNPGYAANGASYNYQADGMLVSQGQFGMMGNAPLGNTVVQQAAFDPQSGYQQQSPVVYGGGGGYYNSAYYNPNTTGGYKAKKTKKYKPPMSGMNPNITYYPQQYPQQMNPGYAPANGASYNYQAPGMLVGQGQFGMMGNAPMGNTAVQQAAFDPQSGYQQQSPVVYGGGGGGYNNGSNYDPNTAGGYNYIQGSNVGVAPPALAFHAPATSSPPSATLMTTTTTTTSSSPDVVVANAQRKDDGEAINSPPALSSAIVKDLVAVATMEESSAPQHPQEGQPKQQQQQCDRDAASDLDAPNSRGDRPPFDQSKGDKNAPAMNLFDDVDDVDDDDDDGDDDDDDDGDDADVYTCSACLSNSSGETSFARHCQGTAHFAKTGVRAFVGLARNPAGIVPEISDQCIIDCGGDALDL